MKNFKHLKIWQKGIQIALDSFHLVKNFPNDAKRSLSSQITRAAVSIPSNIAEGCSRTSIKEFCRYIEISLGSSFELETQILVARKLNFGEETETCALLADIDQEQKMLMSFKNTLLGHPPKPDQ